MADNVLRSVCPELPQGYSHWVLASQTCNVFNPDFEKVPSVEWVGANEISEDAVTSSLKNGLNPRRLHCHAEGIGPGRRFFDCDVYARIWHNRKLLAEISSDSLALKDTSNTTLEGRQKDVFVGWLARSYTRLELSNELVKALKNGGIERAISNILKSQADNIYGIFLEIAPWTASDVESEDELVPSTWKNPVLVTPPAAVEITIVVKDAALIPAVLALAKDEFTKLVDDPDADRTGASKPVKVKRNDLALRNQIYMTIDDSIVKAMGQWSAKDILRTVRYSSFDSLSDTTETDGV